MSLPYSLADFFSPERSISPEPSDFDAFLQMSNSDPLFGIQPAIQEGLPTLQLEGRIITPGISPRRIQPTTEVDGARVASSPVRRLPQDVLSEIFLECVPKRDPGDFFTVFEKAVETFDVSKSPWVLAQVSQRWREVALNFPILWSFIHVTSDIKERDVAKFSRSLNTLLLRSANYPLSIYIDSSIEELWDTVLGGLLPHSLRWRDIEIIAQPTFFNRLAIVKGRLPLLRSAKLNVTFHGREVDFFPIILYAFDSCPRLRDVKVIDSSSPFRLVPDMPWSQLTRFSGTYSAFQHLVYLQRASNLVECCLSIDSAPRELGVSLGALIVRLPHLAVLILDGDITFLNHLSLPELSSLTLNCSLKKMNSVLRLIRRSSCELTHLCLTSIDFRDHDLAAVLQMTPRLKSLALEYEGNTPSGATLFTWLAAGPSQQPLLLPYLSTFTISLTRDARDRSGLEDGLMKMIEARRRIDQESGGSRLRRLKTVDFGYMPCSDEARSRLRALMDDGLEVLWDGCTEAELRHSRARWQWLESAPSRRGDLGIQGLEP
jgi:hypothetical protein